MSYISKLRDVIGVLNKVSSDDVHINKFISNLSNYDDGDDVVMFYCKSILYNYYELYIYSNSGWWGDVIYRSLNGDGINYIEYKGDYNNIVINDITISCIYLPEKQLIEFVYKCEVECPKVFIKLFKLHRSVISISNLKPGFRHRYDLYSLLMKGLVHEII